MKKILILGAGLSASSLIRYLLHHAQQENWLVQVADRDIALIQAKLGNHPLGQAIEMNALDAQQRGPYIDAADLVISMLPARFHAEVVTDCVDRKTNVLTPSYVSEEIQSLDEKAKANNVVIMNELGVDPGIDHMSAMEIIDGIKEQGGAVASFKSFTGGLIAPENDDNPLHYKFTWNPRNVVLAGQGGAICFIQQGEYKYIPYHRLFTRLERIEIPQFGSFEGYANRDSLKYRSIYGLEEISTIYRGTLRRPGFSSFWNRLVQLGLTDDSYPMANVERMTPRLLLNAFLPFHPNQSVEAKLKEWLNENGSDHFDLFKWLGFFDGDTIIGRPNASPAQLLQVVLESKMALGENDKDMIVMHHEFEYILGNQRYRKTAQLVNIGEDKTYTSMSNTVGLPLAICAKLLLKNQIQLKGVQLPLSKEVYQPVLKELADYGIVFQEITEPLH